MNQTFRFYFAVLIEITLSCLLCLIHVSKGELVTFDWLNTDCSNYPFAEAGGFDFCGAIEFCRRETGGGDLYGYKQVGKDNVNCTSPGPTIRVTPGKKYLMTLRNSVPGTTTNIHTHGVHISGDGNADNILRTAEANECVHYVWDIPSTHMGGTHWYHSHKHQQSSYQVGNGAHGVFIVDDNIDVIPAGTPGFVALSRFLTLDDITVQLSHTYFDEWMGNGEVGGTQLSVFANQWTRLRISISNPYQEAPTFNVLPVSIDTTVCPDALVIAYDGVYTLEVPGRQLPVNTTGAGRVDVAIRCPNVGAVGQLKYGTRVIGFINVVEGGSAGAIRAPTPYAEGNTKWAPVRPHYIRDLRNLTSVDNNLVVNLTNFVVNGRKWDPLDPIAAYAVYSTSEWTILGSQNHPLHVHVQHMQIIDCGTLEPGSFHDTVAAETTCLVRLTHDDFAGQTVLHCHDLDHEDAGMLASLAITGGNIPNGNPDLSDSQCYGQTPAPTSAPVAFTCRAQEQLRCQNRIGKTGRWMYIGQSPSDRQCRQKCAVRKAELDGNTAWQCGTCARVSNGELCSESDKCVTQIGNVQGYWIRKGYGTSNCRYECGRYDGIKLQFLGWECGYC